MQQANIYRFNLTETDPTTIGAMIKRPLAEEKVQLLAKAEPKPDPAIDPAVRGPNTPMRWQDVDAFLLMHRPNQRRPEPCHALESPHL